MYNTFLGDDIAKWPTHAFINLPIVPFSLVLSRTRLFDSFQLLPLILTWSSSSPVQPRRPSIWEWSNFDAQPTPALGWPPTPLMIMVIVPFVRVAYRRLLARLTRYVMGPQPTHNTAEAPLQRVVLDLNGIQVGANRDPVAARPAVGAAAAAVDAGAGNAPDDPALVAERTLHVSTSSLGRFVGGALLIPTISNRMGALLLRLSRHSSFLRAFLAVGHRGAVASAADIRLFPNPPGTAPTLAQFGRGLVNGINYMCGGTPVWNAHEPVWYAVRLCASAFMLLIYFISLQVAQHCRSRTICVCK